MPAGPVTPGGTATVTSEPPVGPVVVYARVTGRGATDDGRYTDHLEIVTYDVGGGGAMHTFRLDDVIGSLASAHLAGDRLYVNLPGRIVSYVLDGSDQKTVRAAADGEEILGFDISDDLARIAYWTSPTSGDTSMTLRLEQLASGELLTSVDGLGMDAFGQYVRWIPEGDAVLADVGSSHDRDLVRVGLDGEVTEYDMRPGSRVSSDRRYALHPVSAFGSGCTQAQMTVRIRDLTTNEAVAGWRTGSTPWAAHSSPDGSAFLFGDSDCTDPDAPTPLWRMVDVNEGIARPVDDPLEVLAQWYGDRLVSGRCGEAILLPDAWPFGEIASICSYAASGFCVEPVELLIGDTMVDSTSPDRDGGARFLVLGFLDSRVREEPTAEGTP